MQKKSAPQEVAVADSKGGVRGLAPRHEIENSDVHHLTDFAVKVLDILRMATTRVTRNDLKRITGVKKGWSKLLGAPTHDYALRPGLCGLKLVDVHISGRIQSYSITNAGRKAYALYGDKVKTKAKVSVQSDLANDLARIIRQANTKATTIKTLVDARLGQGDFRSRP